MKKNLSLVLLLAGVLVGCATSNSTFQSVAGKFLSSTAVTVDSTMTAAAKLEVSGVISPADWASLSADYRQYQMYFAVATNTYVLAVNASNPALFTPASNNLQNSQSMLTTKVSLVQAIQPAK